MPRAANRARTRSAAAAPSRTQRLLVGRLCGGLEGGVRGVVELRADQGGVPGLGGQATSDVAQPDLPERLAPDLADVCAPGFGGRDGEPGVEVADAVGASVVRGRVPVHRAGLRGPDRPPVVTGRVETDRHPEVITERLADGAGVEARAEPGDLVVMHGVAVLVHDHLGVLGVVDAALAEPDQILLVPHVGVVDPVLVDPQVVGTLQDRGQGLSQIRGTVGTPGPG